MALNKVYRAIGLMSGTSLDGVDIACIETDGMDFVKSIYFESYPYTPQERTTIRAALGKNIRGSEVGAAEDVITERHAALTQQFIEKYNLKGKIDIVGFHGQTIFHNPNEKFTWQIGDGAKLAKALGVDVVADMRKADVLAGGQGAPLLPLYHRALVRSAGLKLPVVILNIGGVSNITWIDTGDILAFDCGPGNALMDDFVKLRTGMDYDDQGNLAMQGMPADKNILSQVFTHEFFKKKPPKSLDRDQWSAQIVRHLSTEQGVATLLSITTGAIAAGFEMLPRAPVSCYICGGGRKNDFLMDVLKTILPCMVDRVESLGWNGDATEAEGFAYLAVRSLLGLPLTEPSTTGVPMAMTGGVHHKA